MEGLADDLPPNGIKVEPESANGNGWAQETEGNRSDAREGKEFKSIDWDVQAVQDDEDIDRIFSGDKLTMPEGLDSFGDKEIDQADKDVDAIDFEDISDDDLPSDDGYSTAAAPGISQVPGLMEDEGTSHENDDINALFGEDDLDDGHLASSPPAHVDHVKPQLPSSPVDTADIPEAPEAVETMETIENPEPEKPLDERNISDEEWNKMSFSERMRLNFPQTKEGDNDIGDWVMQTNTEDPSILPPPQTEAELLQHKFPSFEKHKTLFHNQLFPQWPAEYMYKEPLNKDRDPPEFVPTKLELELDVDTSKLFRIPDSALTATHQRSQQQTEDWAKTIGALAVDIDDGRSEDSDSDNEIVGGFTLDEIATICDDWDSSLNPSKPSQEPASVAIADDDEEMDDWDREFLQSRPQKKVPKYEPGLPDISSYNARGFDDFTTATHRFGKRVRLDLNDPYLLIDDTQAERPTKRPKLEEKTKRMANGQLRRDIRHHFNISNDDAYDQLKTNHKNKVRAVLSNRAVEHSLPALKLTYPFYRTRLSTHFWEHHRKKFDVEKLVRHAVGVRKPSKVRKKDWKGKSVIEVFKTSKDLSLNDNSTVVLFEYSEQYPIMMSNFGMGSRVINYYRRKDQYEDEKLDKAEIGESHVLLPEDRSPFSIFGTVDPGETVPTLHNEMSRAPVFKHNPRSTDFLLGYTTNVAEGPKFFLRNIDHIYTVGQGFPVMEVPGPHARKVTNTSKNRLKMISFRMMRKKNTQDVSLAEITPHVFDHHDPQNRQKMKEFLSYDREKKTWVLPEGQTLMDENAIRSMIKPEDVCLIEAMQVGQQLLMHAGYDPKNAKDGGGEEEDDVVEEPLVARMAPWEITKNFIDASAGKAMVALHGEGDPTGHGLGFSFIKTSMKGGYINAVQGPLATSADAIERERKANGGHSYNVKKQQDMYNTAIRQIWDRQKQSLSDDTTHEDADVLDTANEDDRFIPRHSFAASVSHPDDGRSQFSRTSNTSRVGKRKLKIIRKVRNDAGEIVTETTILEDPVVIRSYMRQRKELEEKNRDVYSLQPTADADENREKQKLVDRELMRLLKNQDRRQIREKQGKGKKKTSHSNANVDASPDPSSGDKASAGTTRKCANCGQVGHIKTNKRYWHRCALLKLLVPPYLPPTS